MAARSRRSVMTVCDLTQSGTHTAIYLRPFRDHIKRIGAGWAPSFDAVREGRLERVDRAAESLRESVRLAEKAAAFLSDRRVILGLDDPGLESVKLKGTCFVDDGRGEFSPYDVRRAETMALQTLQPMDKHCVYSRSVGYLVDRKDWVSDPKGICGKELEVVMHLLFSESRWAQRLVRAADRALLNVRALYPSGLAALAASPKFREKSGVGIVVFARPNAAHLMQFGSGALREYRSFVIREAYSDAEMRSIADWVARCRTTTGAAAMILDETRGTVPLLSRFRVFASLQAEPFFYTDSAASPDSSETLKGLAHLFLTGEPSPYPGAAADSFYQPAIEKVRQFVKEYF